MSMEILNLQVEYCIVKTNEKNSKCIREIVFFQKKHNKKKVACLSLNTEGFKRFIQSLIHEHFIFM